MVYVIRPGEQLYDVRWEDDELTRGLKEADFERGRQFVESLNQLQGSLEGLEGTTTNFSISLVKRGVMVVIPSSPVRRITEGTAFSERVVRPSEDTISEPFPVQWLEILMPDNEDPSIRIRGASPSYDDSYNYLREETYFFRPQEHRVAIYLRED